VVLSWKLFFPISSTDVLGAHRVSPTPSPAFFFSLPQTPVLPLREKIVFTLQVYTHSLAEYGLSTEPCDILPGTAKLRGRGDRALSSLGSLPKGFHSSPLIFFPWLTPSPPIFFQTVQKVYSGFSLLIVAAPLFVRRLIPSTLGEALLFFFAFLVGFRPPQQYPVGPLPSNGEV